MKLGPTFSNERTQIRKILKGGDIWKGLAIVHNRVQLSLEFLCDIDTATKLPAKVRECRRSGIAGANAVLAYDPVARCSEIL
jgi:hypothetical protein